MVYHTRKSGLKAMLGGIFAFYLGVTPAMILSNNAEGGPRQDSNPKPEVASLVPELRWDSFTKSDYIKQVVPVMQETFKSHWGERGQTLDRKVTEEVLGYNFDASVESRTPLMLMTSLCLWESKGNPEALGDLDKAPNIAIGYCQMRVKTAKELLKEMKEEGYTGLPDRIDPASFRYDYKTQARLAHRYFRTSLDRQLSFGRSPEEARRLSVRNYQKGMYSEGTDDTPYLRVVRSRYVQLKRRIRV
ncbi:hypothetical protein JW826_01825 [Candidatus Woesearchaeota archaeon]|nr:hypothetical protein [Candidatus Woesearchaeota archaeon]